MVNAKNTTQDPAPQNDALQESEGWRPNEGDVLTGTVHGVSKAWSDWANEFYPLVTIKTDDGALVDVHAFHATLKSRLMEAKPKVGDALEIAYLGKRPTKDGKREVAVYKVTIPGDDGSNAWAALESQNSANAVAAVTGDVPPDTDDIPF